LLGLPVAACNAILDVPDPVLRDAAADDSTSVVSPDAAEESVAVDGPPASPGDDASGDAGPHGDADLDADADAGCCIGDAGCVDLSSDEYNCGVCGRWCQGGSCSTGHCGPVLLAGSPTEYRGLKSLYGLGLLGGRLVGTDWYQSMTLVYTTAVDASSPVPTRIYPRPWADGGAPPANGAADGLVTDGQRVYFDMYRTDNGWDSGIYALDSAGNVTLINGVANLGQLEVDDTFVYWSDGQSTLWRANKDGSQPTRYTTGADWGRRIVAQGGRLYFVSGGILVGTDRISGPVLQYSGSTGVDDFAVDSTFAYWVDLTGQRVYRAPLDGSVAPKSIAPAQLSLTRSRAAILVDDVNAYVFSFDLGSGPLGGSLVRFAKDGSATAVDPLLTMNDGFSTIIQDAHTLYFTTYGNDDADAGPYSAVWKLAK
jgi:hypothetical protein